jgi:predicted RecB family nuclease
MAIRDHKVYVLDLPTLTPADTPVFIDMEGDPAGHFVYLIGLLVVWHGQEKCYSFWGDTREGEAEIFEQMDQVLSGMIDPNPVSLRPLRIPCSEARRIALRAAIKAESDR